MKGFLERWATRDTPAKTKAGVPHEPGIKDDQVLAASVIHSGRVGATNSSPSQSERKDTGGPYRRRMISSAAPRDPENAYLSDAFNKVAALLSTAYRRRKELQREQVGRPRNSVDNALANSAPSSVHGVVP